MRLHAVVLLGALLLGAGACPAAGPPASATNAVRLDVVADDGLTLALWAKAPPAPRGTILLLHGRTWSALPNCGLQVQGTPRSVMDAFVYHI